MYVPPKIADSLPAVRHRKEQIWATGATGGAVPGKALGQFSETVERVNVRGLSVASHGVYIEEDSFNSFTGWFMEVSVVNVQRHGMTNEILCPSLKTKFGINLVHRILVQIDS
jgi:hypothetical protein